MIKFNKYIIGLIAIIVLQFGMMINMFYEKDELEDEIYWLENKVVQLDKERIRREQYIRELSNSYHNSK